MTGVISMQKRIPKNSVTIFLKFDNYDQLLKTINDHEYALVFSRLAAIVYEGGGKLESFTNPKEENNNGKDNIRNRCR